MNKPDISVILPTFNRGNVVNHAIDSILNQTLNNLELIIINDASTDNTKQVLDEYQKKDPRIKIINNAQNYGCAQSRNIGLQHIQSNTIAFMDDDDQYSDTETLKCLYNQMQCDDADIVISDYEVNGELRNMNKFGKNFKYYITVQPGPFLQCVLIKKNLIEKNNISFDAKATPSEDWEFFITLAQTNPLVTYCRSNSFKWQLNQNSQSINFLKEAQSLAYICDKHYKYMIKNIGKKLIGNHYRRIARVYEKTASTNQINAFYKKAFQQYPYSIKNIFYLLMVNIGYNNTKFIINWMRKIRGVPNA